MLSWFLGKSVEVRFQSAMIKRSGFFVTTLEITLGEKTATGKDLKSAWDKAIEVINASIIELESVLRETNDQVRIKKKLARTAIFKGNHRRDIDELYKGVHNLKRIRKTVKMELRRVEKERDNSPAQAYDDAQRLEAGGTYCVYSIDRGSEVYIGISKDFKRRLREHLKRSHNAGVRQLISEGARPTVVASNLSQQEAAKVESDMIVSMRSTSKVVHNIRS